MTWQPEASMPPLHLALRVRETQKRGSCEDKEEGKWIDEVENWTGRQDADIKIDMKTRAADKRGSKVQREKGEGSMNRRD